MKDGFIKVAAVSPRLRVADVAYNTAQIIAEFRAARQKAAVVIVMPELSVTGYTCGDLFLTSTLLDASDAAILQIAVATEGEKALLIVGAPKRAHGKLYNCAVAISDGKILGMTAKYNIPNYGEFYELRYFTPNDGYVFPDITFCCPSIPDFTVGIEICEDLWIPDPPSRRLSQAGATVIVNLSASDEVVGKAEYRRTLVKSASARYKCAYIYCDAGEGESSGDLVYGGHNIIAELGQIIAESAPFGDGRVITEIDLQRIAYDRRKVNTFPEFAWGTQVDFELEIGQTSLTRRIKTHPFVPSSGADRTERCREIIEMQSRALVKRLSHGNFTPIIGVSGGLDSTLALLVCDRAMRILGRSSSEIVAVTMPCFGTTERTKNNAQALCAALGVTFREIDTTEAVTVHLRDIGHGGARDIAYENAQARERTQVLMDIANSVKGGIVIGTGDLSEMALGWSTYNGDQMSMYAVNCGVPKTLVRYLVEYFADTFKGTSTAAVLHDILATPVSPELLPPEDGKIAQRTEEIVGPYELHDFFLYYFLRFGFSPEKILRLAVHAFDGKYTPERIAEVEQLFFRRFFAMQFKRSCTPDGPKIGSVALSPRGDWRMPSDAVGALWE